MPWLQTDPMFERARFVDAHHTGLYSMTELCDRFGISRKTGYKWLARFERDGGEGLQDRSRAPQASPHRTPDPVAELIIEARLERGEGAKKLLPILGDRHPDIAWPSVSTAHRILERAGLVKRTRKRRVRPQHPPVKPLVAAEPNDVWTADFKGEFLLRDRTYCYPLTVVDHHSRFLLGCDALDSTEHYQSLRVFKRLFAEYGLPRAIRTDNGSPFASSLAIHGLSRLSVYWIKLGIRPDRIEPGKPAQNGAHERMHRTLKAATARPPEATLRLQQARFDRFRVDFNEVRPHEALEMRPPAARFNASTRTLPAKLPEPAYPGHAEIRRVHERGTIKFRSGIIGLSTTLGGETVALEEVDDGIWNVQFYHLLLGRLDERTFTFVS
jgi:putative transposase